MESPATTAGAYCQACGYDLRGSLEGGRCPECGRIFSPGEPKTFRRRPFAAPWKGALARWAKRLAILLLVLAVLLGGTWGWYYWGWLEEQAVLAEARVTRSIHEPVVWGGAPGRWLWDHRVPGCFVLERVRDVVLPETATDADLLPLWKLTELRATSVHGPITDAGLVHLARCPRLRLLRLQETRVTGTGFIALAKLPALNTLFLSGTRVTDAGLVDLAKLAALHRLDLSRTGISDAGLVHLEKLRTLQSLVLLDTKVTPTGVARLKAALPGCAIYGP